MAKRYRSLRREQKLLGGKIHFVDHFFPEVSQPPCSDKKICDFIETRPGFGNLFWVYRGDAEDLAIDPSAVPEGVDVGDMELAARKLQQLGYNVNPDLLKKEEMDLPLELPTLSKIHAARKDELLEMVERFGWSDINTNSNVPALKQSVISKVRELMN